MSIKLNRKGAGLAGEDRVKENQNLEMIEQEFAGLESVKTDSAAAKLSALEALAKADAADSLSKNVQTQLNTIVVEGDSSPQAEQASVGARGEDYGGNLKARLDAEYNAVTTQLADKVTKGDVSVTDIDKNKGLIDQSYLAPSLLSQIAGTSGVLPTVAPQSVTRERLVEKVVSAKKTNFFEVSSNLINEKDVIPNSIITSSSNGELVADPNYVVTGFIEIKPNTAHIAFRTARLAFYNAEKVFISSTAAVSWTTPANAYYMRVSVSISFIGISAQINEGTVLKPFELYYERLPYNLLSGVEVETKDIVDGAVDLEKTTIEYKSSNLFNRRTITPNTVILSGASGGVLSPNNEYAVSDFIKVVPGKHTVRNVQRLSYYRVDGSYFTWFSVADIYGTNVVDIPAGVAFARLNVPTVSINTAQMNIGEQLLPYEIGGIYVDGSRVQPHTVNDESLSNFTLKAPITNEEWVFSGEDKSLTRKNGEFLVLDADISKPFTTNVTLPSNHQAVIDATTADVYALYDALMTAYPDYITKTLLGNDASVDANPIYRYDFMPARPSTGQATRFPKSILISGIHPEQTAVFTLYQAMRNICQNWRDSEALEALRFNFHFIVVPVAQPWGYDARSRVNYNQTDISRNFPNGWIQGTLGSNTYGGSAPLSEVETQYLNQLMLDNLDAITMIDFHNYFSIADNYSFLWGTFPNKFVRTIQMAYVQRMDRKWKKENAHVSQDLSVFIGTANGDAPGGSMGNQADAYGIKGSCSYEVGNRFYPNPNGTENDSMTLTMAYEAFINFVLFFTNEVLRRQ